MLTFEKSLQKTNKKNKNNQLSKATTTTTKNHFKKNQKVSKT